MSDDITEQKSPREMARVIREQSRRGSLENESVLKSFDSERSMTDEKDTSSNKSVGDKSPEKSSISSSSLNKSYEKSPESGGKKIPITKILENESNPNVLKRRIREFSRIPSGSIEVEEVASPRPLLGKKVLSQKDINSTKKLVKSLSADEGRSSGEFNLDDKDRETRQNQSNSVSLNDGRSTSPPLTRPGLPRGSIDNYSFKSVFSESSIEPISDNNNNIVGSDKNQTSSATSTTNSSNGNIPTEKPTSRKRKISGDHPKEALKAISNAAKYFAKREYEAALSEYELALSYSPALAESDLVNLNKGVTFYQLGRLDEAILCFQIAVDIGKDWDSPYFYLGTAYKARRNFEDALVNFRRAHELNPENKESFTHYAHALISCGKWEETLRVVKERLALDPNDVNVIECMFIAHANRKDYKSASEFALRIIQYNANPATAPKVPMPWYPDWDNETVNPTTRESTGLRLKTAYPKIAERRLSTIRYVLDRAAKIHENERASADLVLLLRLGAVKAEPCHDSLVALYESLQICEDIDGSLLAIKLAQIADPTKFWAFFCEGCLYVTIERYEDALVSFNKCCNKDIPASDKVTLEMYIATCLFILKRFEECIGHLKYCLDSELDEKLIRKNAISMLADSYIRLNRPNDLLSFLEPLPKTEVEHASLYYDMAWAHTFSGSYDKALLDYENALKLNPSHEPSINGLAQLKKQLQMKETRSLSVGHDRATKSDANRPRSLPPSKNAAQVTKNAAQVTKSAPLSSNVDIIPAKQPFKSTDTMIKEETERSKRSNNNNENGVEERNIMDLNETKDINGSRGRTTIRTAVSEHSAISEGVDTENLDPILDLGDGVPLLDLDKETASMINHLFGPPQGTVEVAAYIRKVFMANGFERFDDLEGLSLQDLLQISGLRPGWCRRIARFLRQKLQTPQTPSSPGTTTTTTTGILPSYPSPTTIDSQESKIRESSSADVVNVPNSIQVQIVPTKPKIPLRTYKSMSTGSLDPEVVLPLPNQANDIVKISEMTKPVVEIVGDSKSENVSAVDEKKMNGNTTSLGSNELQSRRSWPLVATSNIEAQSPDTTTENSSQKRILANAISSFSVSNLRRVDNNNNKEGIPNVSPTLPQESPKSFTEEIKLFKRASLRQVVTLGTDERRKEAETKGFFGALFGKIKSRRAVIEEEDQQENFSQW